MPPIDEEYDLLLTEDFGGGGSGGAGFPSHNGDDETLLYPTLASTSSTMPKTDTKKAFFLLGLIGAVADLDRDAVAASLRDDLPEFQRLSRERAERAARAAADPSLPA